MPEPGSPRRRDLNYQWLEDFTAGISDRVSFVSSVFQNNPVPGKAGAAQADNTWGCVGSPDGGLMPGPRIIPQAAYAGFANANTLTDNRLYGSGLYAAGPFLASDNGGQTSFAPEDMEAVFAGSATLSTNAGGAGAAQYVGVMVLRRPWESDLSTSINLGALHGADTTAMFVPGATFAETQSIRTADSDNTQQGYPIIMHTVNSLIRNEAADTTFHGGAPRSFPDIDTSSGATDVFSAIMTLIGAAGSGFYIAHQGRLVGAKNAARAWGLNGIDPSLAALVYTTVNDVLGGTLSTLVIPDLGSDGVYSMFSVNASELFLVRGRGGAISIRGDLANPTIIRFPGVQSTEGVRTVGTNSPLGYVYGSRSGVFVWKGGDESTNLSPNMSGPFWLSQDPLDNMNRHTIHGSFAYSNPFVFVPNNYMLDTRTGAWWRYSPIGGITEESLGAPELPASAFGYHAVGPYSGDVYAQSWSGVFSSGSSYRNTVRIAKQLQTCHYKWTSQPLPWTVRRVIDVRDIVLVAQGSGTVTITLASAFQPLGAQSKTFTINSTTNPILIPTDSFSFQGEDVILTIESNSGTKLTPAPVVWRVGFGLAGRGSVPNG